MTVATDKHTYSFAEYLELEETANYKKDRNIIFLFLISQNQYYVMQYNKTNEGKWLLTEYEGENSILSLISVNFEITFHELYEGVAFD